MTLCSFAEQAGCKECKAISYKTCEKFKQQYVRHLGRELTPFVGVNVTLAKESVVWSSKENVMKSMALLRAIKEGESVAKFDLNQVFQIVLHQVEIELPKVVYFELGKSSIDKDKISGIVESFLAALSLRNSYVYIYRHPSSSVSLQGYYKYE